jgi:hypothetical protein
VPPPGAGRDPVSSKVSPAAVTTSQAICMLAASKARPLARVDLTAAVAVDAACAAASRACTALSWPPSSARVLSTMASTSSRKTRMGPSWSRLSAFLTASEC